MTLRERIERQIELLRYDKQWAFVEWSVFRPILERTFLNLLQPAIEEKEEEKDKVINELQQENRRLQGQLNMRLGKDQERDHQIVALHKQG